MAPALSLLMRSRLPIPDSPINNNNNNNQDNLNSSFSPIALPSASSLLPPKSPYSKYLEEQEEDSTMEMNQGGEGLSEFNLLNDEQPLSFMLDEGFSTFPTVARVPSSPKQMFTLPLEVVEPFELEQSLVLVGKTTNSILEEEEIAFDDSLASSMVASSISMKEDSVVLKLETALDSSLKGKDKTKVVEDVPESVVEPLVDMDPVVVIEGSKPARSRPSLAPLPKAAPLPSLSPIVLLAPNCKKVPILPKYVLPKNHPSRPRRLSVLPPPSLDITTVPHDTELLIKKPYLKRSAPVSTNETIPIPHRKSSIAPRKSQAQPLVAVVDRIVIEQIRSVTPVDLAPPHIPKVTFALPSPSFSPILASPAVSFSPILPHTQGVDISIESMGDVELLMSWGDIGRMTSTPKFERMRVDPRISLAGIGEIKRLPRRSEVSVPLSVTRGTVALERERDVLNKESGEEELNQNRRASRVFGSRSSVNELVYQPIASTSTLVPPTLSGSTSTAQPVLESSTNRRASRAFNSPPPKRARLSTKPNPIVVESMPLLKEPPTISTGPSKLSTQGKRKASGLTLPSGFGLEMRGVEREEERKKKVAEREHQRREREKENETELKKRKSSWTKVLNDKEMKLSSVEAFLPSSLSSFPQPIKAVSRPPRSRSSEISSNRRRSLIYNDSLAQSSMELTKAALEASLGVQNKNNQSDLKNNVSRYLAGVMMETLEEEVEVQSIAPVLSHPVLQKSLAIIPLRTTFTTTTSAFTFSTTTRPSRQPLLLPTDILPPTQDEVTRKRKLFEEGEKRGSSRVLSGMAMVEKRRLEKEEWDRKQKLREEEVKRVKEVQRKEAEESAKMGLKRLRDSLAVAKAPRQPIVTASWRRSKV